jgi:CubicO group peptidase (beta-lactamase class C family)
MPSAAAYLGEEVRLVQEPGSGFLYSNVGFNLLEVLTEDVTGEEFAAYMDAAVLRPLGISDASYAWEAGMAGRVPTGYELDGTPVAPYVYPVSGAGGLVADVAALARFVAASMSTAGTVLEAESIELMHRPVVEVTGLFGLVADGYGLGHFTETLPDGRRAVWHGGQGHGWMTHFHAIPSSGDGIVILTNSQRSWPFIARLLSDWARWSGAGRVKFGRIVWAGRVLRAAVVALALAVLAGAYRVARELLRGERRVAVPTAGARRRWLPVALGGAILAGLLWAVLQPYLFVLWIFPVMAPWAGLSLLGCGLVLIAAAVLPRRSGSA